MVYVLPPHRRCRNGVRNYFPDPNLTRGAYVLMITGTNMEGVEAAGELLTDLPRLTSVLRGRGLDPARKVEQLELLIRLECLTKSARRSEVVLTPREIAVSPHFLRPLAAMLFQTAWAVGSSWPRFWVGRGDDPAPWPDTGSRRNQAIELIRAESRRKRFEILKALWHEIEGYARPVTCWGLRFLERAGTKKRLSSFARYSGRIRSCRSVRTWLWTSCYGPDSDARPALRLRACGRTDDAAVHFGMGQLESGPSIRSGGGTLRKKRRPIQARPAALLQYAESCAETGQGGRPRRSWEPWPSEVAGPLHFRAGVLLPRWISMPPPPRVPPAKGEGTDSYDTGFQSRLAQFKAGNAQRRRGRLPN